MFLWEAKFFVVFAPLGNHNAFGLILNGHGLPYFLGNIWHKRVEKLKQSRHNVNQNVLRRFGGLSTLGDTRLGKLDVPVAVNVPYKVVNLTAGYSEFVSVNIIGYVLNKLVVKGQQPFVLYGKIFGEHCLGHILRQVHQNIP